MLVSHRKKFIFTKTVKTAGTSVESYFEKYCMPDGEWCQSHAREEYVSDTGIIGYRGGNPKGKTWFNHMSAKRISELLGQELWDGYFKFTVVRNPFDKLISGFYFNFHRGVIKNAGENSEIELFRAWVRNGGVPVDRDKYIFNNEECVDYFIRYEKLKEGIAHVCAQLSIPFIPSAIPEFKKGVRNHECGINDFYDKNTIQIVLKRYSWEVERFGYYPP
jgi:hypothetical protein